MSREANVASLRLWNDNYQGHGLEATRRVIDEVFDPEIEFSPLLAREVEGRAYHGRDEVRAFFEELNDMLGGMRYSESEYQVVSDDVIVLLTTLSGTARGSDVPVEQDLALVCEFRDGLVLRLTAYGSRDEALEAAQEAVR